MGNCASVTETKREGNKKNDAKNPTIYPPDEVV